VVYGLGWIMNRFIEPIPLSWQHVLSWGGLRGGVSLALALSLPVALGNDRELLRVMAFGVVLFTLIAQGATMRPLLQRLNLVTRDGAALDYERVHARLTALRRAEKRLEDMQHEGLLSTPAWEDLHKGLNDQITALTAQLRQTLDANPLLRLAELFTAQRELLRTQRDALRALRNDGVISEEVFQELAAEIDAELTKDKAESSGDAVTPELETIASSEDI